MATPTRLQGGKLTSVEDELGRRAKVPPELAVELRAHSIATLAELRKTRGDNAGNRGPRACMLAGYETPLDGGEGVFIWDYTSVAADDGGTSTVLVAGVEQGRWRRAQLYPDAVIAVRVLTNGTTSYTPTPGTRDIIIELWGGGGSGGGAVATGAATVSVGGGGGSGGYLKKRIANIGAGPFTVAIGGGGTGASGLAGNAGGVTTFNDGTTTYTANGGGAGAVSAAVGVVTAADGGIRAGVSTNGDINGYGVKGQFGLVCTTTTGFGGWGASTSLGGGASGAQATGAGSSGGTNTGSGGGGAMGNNAAAQTGGNGAAGLMVITELG